MEEDLNEDEVEERLYAMLHYAAEPQIEPRNSQEDLERALQAAPTSTLRRYWRASEPAPRPGVPAPRVSEPATPAALAPQTLNTFKPATTHNYHKNKTVSTSTPKTNSKSYKSETTHFNTIQSSLSADKPTVQIISVSRDAVVTLESSDEDDVVEVALPPKPTITIESSDEEEIPIQTIQNFNNGCKKILDPKVDREISTSPVPSVVSSVSDDFIRGDCIALNISSKRPVCHSFDFSLHGTDLVDTPAKKKKKKNRSTSTSSAIQITEITAEKSTPSLDPLFATPKTKSKKKQKTKSFKVVEQSVPQLDVYDSDSNQSVEVNKTLSFTVSDKSCPNADIYESDSSQSEILRPPEPVQSASSNNSSTESEDKQLNEARKTPVTALNTTKNQSFVDLTSDVNLDDDTQIVMGNVSGFQESDNSTDREDAITGTSQLGSTREPEILAEGLDFEFLKGGGGGEARGRRYSRRALREDMRRFYDDSWGGENFNHKEIQKSMSRDRSLWEIDPRDRAPRSPANKKPICGHCGRAGHRGDQCFQRPKVCHMCGQPGHQHTRCPHKICVNCGSPSPVYAATCARCAPWGRERCPACRRAGHPAPHCPDLWRRYHNTIDVNVPLAREQLKPPAAQHCSVCARRGHLAHACRGPAPAPAALAPLVLCYEPLYPPDPLRDPPAPAANEDHTKVKERRMSVNRDAMSNTDKNGREIQDNEVSGTSEAVTTARIYVTQDAVERLRGAGGQQWLRAAASARGVSVDPRDQFLYVTGTIDCQEGFQADLKEWCAADSEQPEEATVRAASAADDIPRNRKNMLRQLNRALDSLNGPVGDPGAMFRELNYLRDHREKLMRQKAVSPKQLANNREYIQAMVKKLNMVLVGQAGLGGGALHVAALRSLRARLGGQRGRQLPQQLREEIGGHYSRVFAATPRDDYHHLIQMYYRKNPTRPPTYRRNQPPTFQVTELGPPGAGRGARPAPAASPGATRPGERATARVLGQAGHCHRRLQQARPGPPDAQRVRAQLARKLHAHIKTLQAPEHLSSKQLMRIKKFVHKAQQFLQVNV